VIPCAGIIGHALSARRHTHQSLVVPAKKQSTGLTKGRTKRALQVGSLTTSVGTSYLWHTLKRPFQSASKKEQELFDLHLKNALRIVDSSRELRGASQFDQHAVAQ